MSKSILLIALLFVVVALAVTSNSSDGACCLTMLGCMDTDQLTCMGSGGESWHPGQTCAMYNCDCCCVLRVGDASVMIDAKFISGTCIGLIDCLTEADTNQSGGIDPTCADITIGDISVLIDYLFITGPSLGLADCL